ncbi:Golgi transport complex subunit 5-domain-containing protein [Kockovaella imperatae]|uniref:Conserved oligomeric Golgi complex subunit 5 n=1 Tax=Kockovaella imperatae TaxID=4999 RepID=A0A1Y1UDE9_9TREE|nr:Golgi transport complex subunit 5-domain-containing protein [Kockovaella imperatae]ORX36009.1 Golgi transport complex subunit 5-domain-containing protein [Kockovaella imperatae]
MKIDEGPFLSDNFDVNAYANAVLAGQNYDPDKPQPTKKSDEKGDVGLELAKLNYGIEDVTKQLRREITSSHPLLLAHLTTSLSLSSHLSPIRSSLTSLSSSLDRLHAKIHEPYEHLALLVRRIQVLTRASDLTRRAARYVLVVRRLENQMEQVKVALEASKTTNEDEGGRELAKAALSVAELDALLEPVPDEDVVPLQSLEVCRAQIPKIDRARDTIIQEMESMVVAGLADLNQALLSSSLQTAHNLRLLPDLVSNLLADLNDAVTLRIQRAFDSAAIGKEVAGKAIKFRSATEPTNSTKDQWVKVLWSRLGRVMEDITNACIKVYTLEKVLKLKKDASNVDFLTEVMKSLDEKPSFTFWTNLAQAFETQSKETKSSAWLQQALSAGYPRLLRLFHDFFAKIAVHTDTVYTTEHQSTEAVLVLRSVAVFETLYLTRSTTRMNDIVNAATTFLSGRGVPPGPAEGVSIARVVTNELDSARFDPLLARTVARNAVKVLDTLLRKLEGAMVRDFTATSVIGPQATPAQSLNAQLVSCIYHCRYNLLFVQQEFTPNIWQIVLPAIEAYEKSYKGILAALDIVIKREMSSILSRLHKVDFAKPVEHMGGNAYMEDLIDKIAFIKGELLGRMSLGDAMREQVLELSRYILRTFLVHASIARPLGESGKLKLTGDMTELEVGVSSLLTVGQIQGQRGGVKIDQVGEEYLALRAFRQLLFSDISLTNPVETVHLPPLIILHHIIVLSPLLLPHQVHHWTESEYVLWLQKHEPAQQLDLLEKAVNDQAVEGDTAALIKEVLAQAE